MTKYWIGVASLEHVEVGVLGGFCQLNHGKKRALDRMSTNDWLIYYSPKKSRQDIEGYQKFTALGQIQEEDAYQYEMFPGFVPYRKEVTYTSPITELPLQALDGIEAWTECRSQLRFGHFEISKELFDCMEEWMTP